MVCNQCNKELPSDGDYLTCSKCNNSYHLECSGLRKTTGKTKSKSKTEWECINCRPNKSRTLSGDLDLDMEDPTVNSLKRIIEQLFKKQEKTIIDRVDNIMEVVTRLEDKFLGALDKMKEIEEKTVSLEKDIIELKTSLEMEKQYGRSKNFIITSIPQVDKEDVRQTVADLLKSMEIVIKKEEITAHRLPSKNGPASIIVQCSSRETRDLIVRRARKLKPKMSFFRKDAFPDRAVYFNDHLTPYFSDLMAKTNQVRKVKGYKYIWMNGNRIMVRKDNISKAIQVTKQEDIKNII